jgi:hypothetical protein
MPFANESGNSDLDYLSDGLTETLIGSLAQLPDLSVKARSSVFPIQGKGCHADGNRTGSEGARDVVGTACRTRRPNNSFMSRLSTPGQAIRSGASNTIGRCPKQQLFKRRISREVSHKLRAKLSTTDEQKVA